MRCFFIFILFLFSTCIYAQVPSYVPTSGLQCWYGFNGNFNDESGSNNLIANNVSSTLDRFGNPNSAYYFNGVNSFMSVSAFSHIFSYTGHFTVSVWVRKVNGGMVLMSGSNVSNNFIWLLNSDYNSAGFIHSNLVGVNKQSLNWTWLSSSYQSPCEWQHIVFTYSNGLVKLYKNGIYETSTLASYSNINNSSLPLYVGKEINGNNFFKGDIDDIGIWNRVLTDSEISQLNVNSSALVPIFNQVAPICLGSNLQSLPTTSLNGITGTWQPSLNNTATTTYTFTPNPGQCAATTTITVTVNSNVTPIFTQVSAICSGDTLSPLPTTSNNGIEGTWSPALNNTVTTTYTFTPDADQCATTVTMTIAVNPNCVKCSIANKVTTLNESYEFTGPIPGIIPGSIYHTNTVQATGIFNGMAHTGNSFLYMNFVDGFSGIAYSKNISVCTNIEFYLSFWIRQFDNGLGSNFKINIYDGINNASPLLYSQNIVNSGTVYNQIITSNLVPSNSVITFELVTLTPGGSGNDLCFDDLQLKSCQTTPIFTQVAAICSGTTFAVLPTTSNNGITGSWSPALNNITTTTYTFTPDAGQCATTATMTVDVISSNILPIFEPISAICSGTLSSPLPTISTNGITGSWSPAFNNITTTTYTFTPDLGQCAIITTMTIAVNPIPTFTITAAQNPICSGEMVNISFTSTIAATQYSWTVTSQVGVTGALSGSGQSINQTLLVTSPITSGTVTYLITPSLNGCMGIPKSITITVNPRPEIIGTLIPQSICSGESTNITVAASIVGTQFSFQVIDANQVTGYSNGTGGVIQQILTTVGDLQGYVIYEVTPSLNGCVGIPKQYKVFVNPLPKPVLISGPICVSTSGIPFGTYELNTGLNTIDYQFSWFLNGNLIVGSSASLVATQPGNYLVKVKNIHTNCQGQATALVFPITPATSMSVTVSEAFSDHPTITVNVIALGNGNLMYQLDGGSYQESNIFYNVEEGMHEIHVVDQEGCTDLYQNVRVINYPKFFTPNGDGYNDTWNINGFQSGDNAVLYIFDRYGKLIKQLFAPGIGWDGTYLGQQLPSTDYWFTVEYTEKQQRKLFKSHFSLKK